MLFVKFTVLLVYVLPDPHPTSLVLGHLPPGEGIKAPLAAIAARGAVLAAYFNFSVCAVDCAIIKNPIPCVDY